jgi:hypothetical protein
MLLWNLAGSLMKIPNKPEATDAHSNLLTDGENSNAEHK